MNQAHRKRGWHPGPRRSRQSGATHLAARRRTGALRQWERPSRLGRGSPGTEELRHGPGQAEKLAGTTVRLRACRPSSPSGGCLLTDPGFCRRLADLMRCQEKISVRDVELLKIGRHFRLGPEVKLIVGRNETENESIEQLLRSEDYLLYVPETGSPNAMFLGSKKFLRIAAAITARYSDKKNENNIEVFYTYKKETIFYSISSLLFP